jgi:hypothetical protein
MLFEECAGGAERRRGSGFRLPYFRSASTSSFPFNDRRLATHSVDRGYALPIPYQPSRLQGWDGKKGHFNPYKVRMRAQLRYLVGK